ncbi:MAG TPA: DUF5996 family protein [Gemmatimonadaceae bacterium]|nr:DUF5996 family protein [Gemmatimonadaceae bacterium]
MPPDVRGAADSAWPSLSLEAWRDTHATLHMWLQIVGKTRLALAPMENHWWQTTLYVTPRGYTTSAMPYGTRTLAVDVDFIDHQLNVRTSDRAARVIPLVPKSVATFYAEYLDAFRSLGVDLHLYPVPVEVETAIPFADDDQHAAYDRSAAERCWRMFVQADRVLKQFRGGFIGKASPVHFFWGSFDLAYTRFSGRRAPPHPGGAPHCPAYVMAEAYSHECSSAGFWPGGGAITEPAFYAYAYPEPPGYADRSVAAGAFYSRDMGEFILPYRVHLAVRGSADLRLARRDVTRVSRKHVRGGGGSRPMGSSGVGTCARDRPRCVAGEQ